MLKPFIILLLIFKIFSNITFAHKRDIQYKLDIFDINKEYEPECNKLDKDCYSLEDLVKRALLLSTESREEIQLLYQARAAVKIKMGQILPQISPVTAITAAVDSSASVDTALPFVGFLFPNRWFDYKATRRLREAQKYTMHTMLANRAQVVTDLYYDIQRQIWSIRILEFYIHEINNLIDFLKSKRAHGKNKASKEDIAVLENIKGKLLFDQAFLDSLSASLPQLASAIGLEPDFDWYNLKIQSQAIGTLIHEEKKKYQDFWPQATHRSTEIKSAEFIIQAAKNNKKIPFFDFLDPSSQNNLNLGYIARIKSAKSKVEVHNIYLMRTRMQLSNAIQNALNTYNDAIQAFSGVARGITKLEEIRVGVEKHINNTNYPFDINRVTRYFKYSKTQALSYIAAYFYFLGAKADLNRYTWEGKIYDLVQHYILVELPTIQKEARKAQSIRNSLKYKLHKKKHPYAGDTKIPTTL